MRYRPLSRFGYTNLRHVWHRQGDNGGVTRKAGQSGEWIAVSAHRSYLVDAHFADRQLMFSFALREGETTCSAYSVKIAIKLKLLSRPEFSCMAGCVLHYVQYKNDPEIVSKLPNSQVSAVAHFSKNKQKKTDAKYNERLHSFTRSTSNVFFKGNAESSPTLRSCSLAFCSNT